MAKVNVSEEDVKKIAQLARLKLEGDELKLLTHDFNQILTFVEDIEKIDMADVEQVSHVLDQKNISREDKANKKIDLADIEKIAPEFENRSFVVPRVIESES